MPQRAAGPPSVAAAPPDSLAPPPDLSPIFASPESKARLLAEALPFMQRYNFDFFVTQGLLVGTAAARPGGTLGNPVFLASLLLLVIPLTAARVLSGTDSQARRTPWLVLLALQLFTVLLTQSRGPLLGLALALFVLTCTLGA